MLAYNLAMPTRRHVALLFLAALFVPLAPAVRAQSPLPVASPEPQGFSPERLERLHGKLASLVGEARYAGAVVLIARDGKIVDWWTTGQRDIAAGLPMEKDTIVRIYSMTKLVTSVAAMILVEEGRLRLDDPVSKYLPAFARMEVWKGGTAAHPQLAPASKPITIEQLLTHTSGLVYGFGQESIDEVYQKADPYGAATTDAFVATVSKLPLAFEPGDRFAYGFGVDVAGAVIEKVTGQGLDRFIAERIATPLGLADTAFSVPPPKRGRLAKIYSRGEGGKLVEAKPFAGVSPEPGHQFACGGACLFSTAGDYARLLQMLLGKGALDGQRILGRKTVELMLANHLTRTTRPTTEPGGANGFGIGGAVRVELGNASYPGSIGQFGWSGAATTSFSIDPREKTLAVLLTQHLPFNEDDLLGTFSTLVAVSLVD